MNIIFLKCLYVTKCYTQLVWSEYKNNHYTLFLEVTFLKFPAMDYNNMRKESSLTAEFSKPPMQHNKEVLNL